MRKLFILALCVLAASTMVSAQRGTIKRVESAAQRLKFEPWRPPSGNRQTKVVGTVIDIKQTPVKKAKLRLRNLANGTITQELESNDAGEYSFDLDESGTFVVEMVMPDGNVVGLSNAGTLARNQTMNTVIQLPGKWEAGSYTMTTSQGVTSFMGMSAQSTMTSQTLELAAATNIGPADAGEPVSP